MSKQFKFDIPDELYEQIKGDKEFYESYLLRSLQSAAKQRHRNLTDWIRTITRLKTPVCNWEDLEEQIMKGAIGQRD